MNVICFLPIFRILHYWYLRDFPGFRITVATSVISLNYWINFFCLKNCLLVYLNNFFRFTTILFCNWKMKWPGILKRQQSNEFLLSIRFTFLFTPVFFVFLACSGHLLSWNILKIYPIHERFFACEQHFIRYSYTFDILFSTFEKVHTTFPTFSLSPKNEINMLILHSNSSDFLPFTFTYSQFVVMLT